MSARRGRSGAWKGVGGLRVRGRGISYGESASG